MHSEEYDNIKRIYGKAMADLCWETDTLILDTLPPRGRIPFTPLSEDTLKALKDAE